MRICIINEFFYPDATGGTGTVLSSLVRHLRDRYSDLTIDVITTRSVYRGEAEPLPLQESWQGVSISRIGVPRPRTARVPVRLAAGLLFSLAAMLKLMKRKRYDLVLVTTAPPTLPLATQYLRWISRVPYVYVVYDLFPDVPVALGALSDTGRVARVCRRFQKKWLGAAACIVVLGRDMRDHLAKRYDLDTEKIEVIPVWADDQIVPLSKATRFRRQHGLDGCLVLYAGNFGQCQDFDNLLDAAKYLRDSHPDLTLVFVGEGDKKVHIEERVAREDLHNVRVLPFVPREDFSDLLASVDVSLVTLEPGAEGLGVPSKFYNILASGRPTVAVVSPSSEVARVVAEEGCGVNVEHHQAQELARVLSDLCADPARLEDMGMAARRAYETKYTLEQSAERFYHVIEKTAWPRSRRLRHGASSSAPEAPLNAPDR